MARIGYIIAGLFFGFSMVLRKIGGQIIGPFNMAVIEPATASLVVLAVLLIFVIFGLNTRYNLSVRGVSIGIASGVCLAIALMSLFYGLLRGLVQTGTAVTFAMTILTGVSLSIIFLGEPVSWQRLIGFSLIIVGIVFTVRG